MSDVYQTVTSKIVEAMETAQRWEKPWTSAFMSADGSLCRPVNAVTNKPYRGCNVPLLWSARRSSPRWATYKQWQSVNAQVRHGEKASLIVFWKAVENKPDEASESDGETRSHLIGRMYSVFNSEQVEGFASPVPVASPVAEFDPIQSAEQFVLRTGAIIRHGGDRAFYTPSGDFIAMPQKSQFIGTSTSTAAEAYYGTLLHELTHWTGPAKRCGRELAKRFGDQAYAAEELVAELGAAFLCADLAITTSPRPDHAAYLKSWITILKSDARAIFTASSKAEEAVTYLTRLQAGEIEAVAA